MTRCARFSTVSLLALLLVRVPARAETLTSSRTLTWHADVPDPSRRADEVERPVDAVSAARAADDGQLLPYTLGAAIPTAHADLKVLAGYDTSASAARARTSAEARVADFFALRMEYEHGPGTGGDDLVTFGGRFGLLTQRRHGVDFGAGLFFQPKDFRGEGNIVAALLLARHFGRLGLFSNALFGMDPEGDDASADLRLSALYRAAPNAHLGLETRGRFNVSSDEKRHDAREVKWEFTSGPVATVSFGALALSAIAGPSALALEEAGEGGEHTSFGMLAMAGAGAAF